MAKLRRVAACKLAWATLVASASASATAAHAAAPLTVYAYRQMPFLQPLLDDFTRESGISVSVESGQPEALLARLEAEGAASPADVLLTIDVNNLEAARRAGVLQPLRSRYLAACVPAWLRDKRGYWVTQSLWPRAVLTAPGEPLRSWTYSELADPLQKHRVCVRSSADIYSASFIASAITNLGEAGAAKWAAGVVKNLAAPPFKTGKELMKALEAGTCHVALDNAFYIGRQRSDPDTKTAQAAKSVGVAWPTGWTGKNTGTVFAVSGAALTAHAPHAQEGRRLLEFLARPEVQHRYASDAAEYMALRSMEPPPAFASEPVPRFDRNSLRIDQAQPDAALAVYRNAGWN